jgi:hypothetical protein
MQNTKWYLEWFNQDYLNLYDHHDQSEAEMQVNFLVHALDLS